MCVISNRYLLPQTIGHRIRLQLWCDLLSSSCLKQNGTRVLMGSSKQFLLPAAAAADDRSSAGWEGYKSNCTTAVVLLPQELSVPADSVTRSMTVTYPSVNCSGRSRSISGMIYGCIQHLCATLSSRFILKCSSRHPGQWFREWLAHEPCLYMLLEVKFCTNDTICC